MSSKADPDYWKGWEGPTSYGYIHQVSAESSTKRIALQSGDFQFADWLSPQDKTFSPRCRTSWCPTDPSITTYTIKLKTRSALRRSVKCSADAFSWAFDYDAMIEIMGGFGTRIAVRSRRRSRARAGL